MFISFSVAGARPAPLGAQATTTEPVSSSSGTKAFQPLLSSLHSSSSRISISPSALALFILAISSSSAVAALSPPSSSSDLSSLSQSSSSSSFLTVPKPLLSSTSLDPQLAATAADNDLSLVLNNLVVLPESLQKHNGVDDGVILHKRQARTTPTPTLSRASAPTRTNNNKTPMSTSTTTTASAAPVQVTNPPQGGDNALFGVPSKVGEFNLTAGLLIYLAFMFAFCAVIGVATFQRRRYRNQFREQMRAHNAESGRQAAGDKKRGGAGDDMSDAALFKQASLSRRALMKDVGHGDAEGALAGAAAGGRYYDDRDRDGRVRFGESDPSTLTGRTGGMKKANYNNQPPEQSIELESYGRGLPGRRDPSFEDNNDYSRPPLQESENYYSSSSSSSNGGGYLDQAEGNIQYPRPAYQQSSAYQQQQQPSRSPSPPIFVQRTNSARMPRGDLYDNNNIYRSDSSGRRPAGRSGSGSRRAGAGVSPGASPSMGRATPVDMYGSDLGRQTSSGSGRNVPARSAARGAPSPTPVVRSNSTRLPPQMRVATPQPSSLSNQANNYDYM